MTEATDLDLEACAREPIRIPGSIQPHGALLALDPDTLVVVQAAIGTDDAIALPALGRPVFEVVPAAADMLRGVRSVAPGAAIQLGTVRGRARSHYLVAHRTEDAILVELEAAPAGTETGFDEIFPRVRGFLEGLNRCDTVEALGELAAREVRAITGLDRVLVYRFDEGWNGEVVAEDGNGRLPSYLGLRFPASDIPAQARDLYRLNRLRLIASSDYAPVRIEPAANPASGQPLDLGNAVLRSVSPVHLEYMRNMGTGASMSISLLRGDRLWGLISCHHRDPTVVGFPVRAACDMIGQMLSLQISGIESASFAQRRSGLQTIEARLLSMMAAAAARPGGHFLDGLVQGGDDLLSLTGAHGAAMVFGGAIQTVGETPEPAAIERLIAWLGTRAREDVFVTDHLAGDMPGGAALKDRASGVLAISFSQIHESFVLWFRPEVVQTVTWGGDPRKRAELDPGGLRLHPRTSFAAWEETVRLRSKRWATPEIDAANGLRTAIVDIVLRQAEEMAAISDRLASINRELEAFSYSVSHDLRAPFRHIVGYAQLLKKFEGERLSDRGNRFVDTVIESAISAGELVDDLLSFSQMGRATLTPIPVPLGTLVEDVRKSLALDGSDRDIEWRIAPLPTVTADPMMLKLALQNLIENAIKFTRRRDHAVIEIGADETPDEVTLFVRDNGSGFDMAYVGKLFGVFQRLHRVEEFEGTGIGLANVKRIVERHGGRVEAEGAVDAGATFRITLPRERD
jgi:light-regulated signal transduction histidine kinase (bacteriophytochrome)